ncbi:MAG: single-stranded DNA-binding protein [Oscillospiraceae bacterium]|nr:single-stranded DNA-binding protein [Oscillospiraceae bacterium]
MDEFFSINQVSLTGRVDSVPAFSHESRRELFYTFPLQVERLSGYTDRINVILRQELLPLLPGSGEPVRIGGELRSFNNRSGQGSRLVITVFAREIDRAEQDWENCVELAGTICKEPTLRLTPMGREICDILLAVNRRYGRSDYLPCIAWGKTARFASQLQVGDRIVLSGRIQSREYIKAIDGEAVRRTAFEVSINQLQSL